MSDHCWKKNSCSGVSLITPLKELERFSSRPAAAQGLAVAVPRHVPSPAPLLCLAETPQLASASRGLGPAQSASLRGDRDPLASAKALLGACELH